MKTLLILFAVLWVTGAVGAVFAADPPVKVEARQVTATHEKTPTRELSPMMVEINAAIETARLEVAELKLRYDAAVDDRAAMEIMLEVARVKRERSVEMMRIQLRYARLNGNDELVAELEEIVTKMTAPPVKGEPIPRTDRRQ